MIKLSGGKEVQCDLSKITIKEYRIIFNKETKQDDEDALIARCYGMSLKEYQALPYPDWKVLFTAFFEEARKPLADATSPLASAVAPTSQ